MDIVKITQLHHKSILKQKIDIKTNVPNILKKCLNAIRHIKLKTRILKATSLYSCVALLHCIVKLSLNTLIHISNDLTEFV